MGNNRPINNNLIMYISLGLYALFTYHTFIRGLEAKLFISMTSAAALMIGIKFPLLGMLFSLAAMNFFFSLAPSELLTGGFIKKTWDFGFFMMLIFGFFQFMQSEKSIRTLKMPFFFKVFLVYLGICVVSFLVTLIKYPFPALDTIRTFRSQLGYLFIPVLLIYFSQAPDHDYVQRLRGFLTPLYYLSFFLLLLYVLQFLIQRPIFTGYQSSFSIAGASYLRSIPQFLFMCYFFLWFNLAAWLTNNEVYYGGKIYIFLCFAATLFTFTRGIYISTALVLTVLVFLIFKTKKINPSRLFIAGLIAFLIITVTVLVGYLTPFFVRAASIAQTSISGAKGDDTFAYRIDLLKDRIKLIRNKNAFIGLGFVHNKYGYRFGSFRGNYDEDIGRSGLGCADIAWGNIVYRTGWLGVGAFICFIISIIIFIFKDVNYKDKLDTTALLEISALLVVLGNIVQMMIGDSFTGGDTQNNALMLAIAIFLYALRSQENLYLADR